MPDVINAKCFGCGKIIRVPAALGGRNAKCPGCGNVFTIPTPADSTMDIVPDSMLPTVGESGAPPPKKPATRRIATTRDSPSRRIPILTRRSPVPFIVAGVAGLAVIVAVLVLAFQGARGGREGAKKDPGSHPGGRFDPESEAVQTRTRDYLRAVNSGRHPDITEFFDVADREALKIAITRFLEPGVGYENIVWRETAVRGNEATIHFTATVIRNVGKEVDRPMSLQWRRSGPGSPWKLTDLPK